MSCTARVDEGIFSLMDVSSIENENKKMHSITCISLLFHTCPIPCPFYGP
jgi:hypothetical protein